MTYWRNLVAGAAVTLAIMPSSIFARAHSHRAEPQPSVPYVVLIEDSAGPSPSENFPKISAEKSGTIPTKDGRLLRVNMELGNVQVFTDEAAQISYRAVVEADSRDPGAEEFLRGFNVSVRKTHGGVALDAKVPSRGLRGQFGAAIEVHIPRRYSLEVTTGGGNIEVQDIDGRISVASAGGNISVGRVGDSLLAGRDATGKKGDRLKPVLLEAARIETQGGNITVGDVVGTLRATTSGGHIHAANIGGDAVLRTGGGQIYLSSVAGSAALDSGGGNIRLESAGSSVTAATAGGGLVLRQAGAPLRVTSSDGGITAWLSGASESKTAGGTQALPNPRAASQLSADGGDIVLYIPRKLAATIDATIEQGGGHRVFADSSLPVQVSCRDSADGARAIHCAARLNGGGEVVRVNAASGNIVLRLGDPDVGSGAAIPSGRRSGGVAPAALQRLNSGDSEDFTDIDGLFAEMRRRILESWWGGIPVEAEEMQKHLEHSVAPVYPEVARQAGIEGDVVLRVYVSSGGRVTDLKVLDGPPILTRAAIQAVLQWQYQAPRVNGRPASVVTTLVVSFRLR